MTPLLQRLEQAGLIVRRRSPIDSRAVLVELTSAGTREAETSLLWGSLLLSLTTQAQVENLTLAWFSAAPLVRALPGNIGSLAVLSGIDPGLQQPGVVLRMQGAAAHWTVEHVPTRYAHTGRRMRGVGHSHGGPSGRGCRETVHDGGDTVTSWTVSQTRVGGGDGQGWG